MTINLITSSLNDLVIKTKKENDGTMSVLGHPYWVTRVYKENKCVEKYGMLCANLSNNAWKNHNYMLSQVRRTAK